MKKMLLLTIILGCAFSITACKKTPTVQALKADLNFRYKVFKRCAMEANKKVDPHTDPACMNLIKADKELCLEAKQSSWTLENCNDELQMMIRPTNEMKYRNR